MNCYGHEYTELRNRRERHSRRIATLERKQAQMALDITKLQTAVGEIGTNLGELKTAVLDVAAEMKNNPDQATVDALAAQLESAANDMGTAATSLETLAGKTPPQAPAPPAVGDIVSIPIGPEGENGTPVADHTVTAVATDGSTVTAQPVSGGDPITVPTESVTPASGA